MNVDNLDRTLFPWPEPLVIEVIYDNYDSRLPHERKLALAKIHAKLLRDTIEDDTPYISKLRGEFLTRCAAFGLTRDVIAKVDEAVFFELMRLVGSRFRHSTRLREGYSERLEACLSEVEAIRQSERRLATRPVRARLQRPEPTAFAAA